LKLGVPHPAKHGETELADFYRLGAAFPRLRRLPEEKGAGGRDGN